MRRRENPGRHRRPQTEKNLVRTVTESLSARPARRARHAVPAVAAAGGRAVLVNREFRRLWLAQAASSVCDALFSTTLVLWIVTGLASGHGWAPSASGGILAVAGLAIAVASLRAGVTVDRQPPVTVMARTEIVRTAVAAAAAALSFVPVPVLPAGLWIGCLYAMVVMLQGAGQFFAPALAAAARDLAGPRDQDRDRAARLVEAIPAAAGILGPVLAAPLLLLAGVHAALILDTASFAASWLAVRRLRVASPPPEPHAGLADGLRVFRRSRTLMSLLKITLVCQAGTGAVAALNVWFVTKALGQPAAVFGLFEAACGCGFAAGVIAAGRLTRRYGFQAVLRSGLVTASVTIAAYAVTPDPVACGALLAVFGTAIGVLTTATAPLIQRAAPRNCLGRVMAIWGPANQLASSLSIGAWAAIATYFLRDVRVLLLAAAAVILLAAVRASRAPAEPGKRTRTWSAARPPIVKSPPDCLHFT